MKENSKKNKEDRIIIITMILNLIVAIIKLFAGIVFSFSTLIADSIQSFIDFITDITSLIANRIGKRRANKTYPFGYGQVYAVANLFTGTLLFLIGIFIVYQFFFFEGKINPNTTLFLVMLLIMTIKSLTVYLLQSYGKFFKSELMIEASKESKADLISTFVVLIISVLVILEKYIPFRIDFDKLGSISIAVYVFYVSIKMIVSNIKEILTNTVEDETINKEVAEEIEKIQNVELKKIRVIKMSTYYSLFLKIKVDENITIKQYLQIEKVIKAKLRSKIKSARFIDIEPV